MQRRQRDLLNGAFYSCWSAAGASTGLKTPDGICRNPKKIHQSTLGHPPMVDVPMWNLSWIFIIYPLIFFAKGIDFRENIWYTVQSKRPVGQAAKTLPSHGGDGGSIPPRVTRKKTAFVCRMNAVFFKFSVSADTYMGVCENWSIFCLKALT